jgi:hypothetical protein
MIGMPTSEQTKSTIVTRYEMGQIATLYPQLVETVFGKADLAHQPDLVFVGTYKGRECGFAAIKRIGPLEAKLVAAGAIPGYFGGISLTCFQTALELMHLEFICITAEVDRMNRPALRMALKAGFLVNGMHIATDGTLMVDVLRERHYELSQ